MIKTCLVALLGLFAMIKESNQLECYVCQDQDNNQNKCLETVRICEIDQDQCLTEVRWGSTPFWALTERKHHFISKRCANKMECQEAIADKNHKCERIWYNDWNCTSCCSGDKCNYYVTLAGHSVQALSPILLILSYSFATLFYCLQSNDHRIIAPWIIS